MTSAFWRQRSDVLICLLIQTLLIVVGQSLQVLLLSNEIKPAKGKPAVQSLPNLNINDQQTDSFQATFAFATESEQ